MRKYLPIALCAALAAGMIAACNAEPGPTTAELNLKDSMAFLKANASKEGVQTTESGLQYKVVRSGPAEGAHPGMGDLVMVHYEGKLIDDTVFDSSYERGVPTSFALGAVVEGWNEGLQLMRPGDEWMLYLSPELGYGEGGRGQIPPNSTLIFRVELIDFLDN